MEDEQVVVEIDRPALQRMLGLTVSDDAPMMLTIPAVRIRRGKDVKLVIADPTGAAHAPDEKLMQLLLEAWTMRDAVLAAPELSIKMIARGMGKCSTRATRLLRIAWPAPEIVEAIVEGRHPPRLTPAKLLAAELPISWHAQKAVLGFG